MNKLKAEIFAVGRWNGMDFTVEDLKGIASSFHSLKELHRVPLKMGHNDEQPFTDGQPALGWVTDLFVEGKKLLAEFSDIPDIVFKAFQKKLYRNVSIELDLGVQHKDQFYSAVLSGVALLGADIPAVNTLADLQAYMGRDLSFTKRMAFTATPQQPAKGDKAMDTEEVKALRAQITALETEQARLISENVALKRDQVEMRAKFTAVEKAEEGRKVAEQRSLLSARLEAMVKEQKIAPFTRDEFMRDFDDAKDKQHVVYTVEKLEKTIESNPSYFGAEQARQRKASTDKEQSMSASEIVVARTHEYMAKHGEKNFTVAKKAVLLADKELANRYTKQEA